MLTARWRRAFRNMRIVVLILLFLVVLRSDIEDASRIQADLLLREISDAHLLSGGRLTSMPYPGKQTQNPHLRAVFARLPSYSVEMSAAQRRLLALMYAFDGQLANARDTLARLSEEMPNDAGIHNDLGVVYMGLASSDLLDWFNALHEL